MKLSGAVRADGVSGENGRAPTTESMRPVLRASAASEGRVEFFDYSPKCGSTFAYVRAGKRSPFHRQSGCCRNGNSETSASADMDTLPVRQIACYVEASLSLGEFVLRAPGLCTSVPLWLGCLKVKACGRGRHEGWVGSI